MTRGAPFSPESNDWRLLAAGIDTLAVNIDVDWSRVWRELNPLLEAARSKSVGDTPGIAPIAEVGDLRVLRSKLDHYRYHLRLPGWELFLAGSPSRGRVPTP